MITCILDFVFIFAVFKFNSLVSVKIAVERWQLCFLNMAFCRENAVYDNKYLFIDCANR